MAVKELGFIDLFSKALDVYIKNFYTLIGLSMLLYFIPAFFLTYLNLTDQGLGLISFFSAILIIFVFLFYLSVIFAAGKFVKKQKIGIRTIILGASDFFLRGFIVGMLFVFLLALMLIPGMIFFAYFLSVLTAEISFVFLLLIIPGVIFSVYWVFAFYSVVLENKSGMEALNYSKKLVKERWWKTLGYVILINIITGVFPLLIASTVLNPAANAFFSQLASAIVSPITMIFMTLYFFNLKSAKKIK